MRAVSVVLCMVLCLLLAGCVASADPFEMLRDDYVATVEGSLHGVKFSAQISHESAGEGSLLTVTLYAPTPLNGTTIRRNIDGEVRILCGDLNVMSSEAIWRDLLFLLSPIESFNEITVNESGANVIMGNDCRIELSSDGKPCYAQRGDVCARIISFEKRA